MFCLSSIFFLLPCSISVPSTVAILFKYHTTVFNPFSIYLSQIEVAFNLTVFSFLIVWNHFTFFRGLCNIFDNYFLISSRIKLLYRILYIIRDLQLKETTCYKRHLYIGFTYTRSFNRIWKFKKVSAKDTFSWDFGISCFNIIVRISVMLVILLSLIRQGPIFQTTLWN